MQSLEGNGSTDSDIAARSDPHELLWRGPRITGECKHKAEGILNVVTPRYDCVFPVSPFVLKTDEQTVRIPGEEPSIDIVKSPHLRRRIFYVLAKKHGVPVSGCFRARGSDD